MKPKKVLIVASVISFIEWFQKETIEFLSGELGCEVHVACNTDYMEDTSVERTLAYISRAEKSGVVFHNLCFARSPLGRGNVKAYRALKALINEGGFDLIHCHTPMASILCRLAARRARRGGTKVVYTCHGYHFFQGAPLQNWILFYPAEKFCSRLCDVLITINGEDYRRSLQKMHTPRIEYIPGVGVDVEKFASAAPDRAAKRRELGIPEDAFLILSVGELNENKNHAAVLRAVAALEDKTVVYAVAGRGEGADTLEKLAADCGLGERFRLLGFRRDVAELYHVADAFAFPSFREGLPASLMEAMACGLPCVVSDIRGNNDLIEDGKGGWLCLPDDSAAFAEKLAALIASPATRAEMAAFNREKIRDFSMEVVMNKTQSLYKELLGR